ncbi:hypothetical protein B0J12DRAFT_767451 [Macrophomina phaseolina]|uniref:Uncharacterized protein n=1 Tax=Macrophomina phaseolina TaxID=35725 RepID=A0ABQ8FX88_9PEZI|nr:hypothetical protein B0J12DRAFT_767451 [Macrophomina phaseolina]
MNVLTDKDEWRRKVFDETIVDHWREEAVTSEGQGFTADMFAFCIAELRDKAKRHEESGMTVVLDGEAGVVKSDSIVSTQLKDALRAAVKQLEDVPAEDRDWHPGSNSQVLDLVHPSLYPLVYGRSKVAPRAEIGLEESLSEEIQSSVAGGWPTLWSRKYQWLPAELRFAGDSDVKITSYINNLHPVQHKELYSVLEQLIAKAIPALSLTLSLVTNRMYGEDDLRIPCPTGAEYEDIGPEGYHANNSDEDDEDDDDDPEAFQRRRESRRKLIPPQPRAYRPMPPPAFDLRTAFATDGLQVIVKLANIHLTPANPRYAGGSWHVEGCLNERICATALYYYDCHNVADSRLAFRQRIKTDNLYYEKCYDQDDYAGIEYLYGIESEGPAVQDIGAVQTREGRLLCFPNVFQHQVQPFELVDKERPGHRKIVAVFLVDPYQRIVSTANVPPQQREWRDGGGDEGAVEGLMSSEEAKDIRLGLMDERRVYQAGVQKSFDETTFNFCEH